jgi:predicted nucleic acid-binding protein
VITAVDSNVLLDFLNHDPDFGTASRDALRSASGEGRLLACDVVWAEIAGCFPSISACCDTLQDLEIEFSPIELEAAFKAGVAWRAYRKRGGARTRVAADFLIGAHALFQADRLLTRDHGFYRSCFKDLAILDPRAVV